MQLNIFLKNISDIEQIWKKSMSVGKVVGDCVFCLLFRKTVITTYSLSAQPLAMVHCPKIYKNFRTKSRASHSCDSISFFCTRHILYCIMYIVASAPFVYAVIQITVGTVYSTLGWITFFN